jgi:hypothetical protein
MFFFLNINEKQIINQLIIQLFKCTREVSKTRALELSRRSSLAYIQAAVNTSSQSCPDKLQAAITVRALIAQISTPHLQTTRD